MASVLLRGGRVYSPEDPFATALVVDDGVVAWVGGADGAAGMRADRVVDLGDALVAPAFVDAHVHATATGLALTGLDLTGCRSAGELLDRVARHARAVPADAVVLGTGWDFDGPLPDPDELDRAAGGRPAYLARTDVHGALASAALLARCPDARLTAGLLVLDDHHRVRRVALDSVTPAQRRAAQRATRARAASLGIAVVHEMAGPEVSSAADLAGLLELAATEPGPAVAGYWGALGDLATPVGLGITGAGGDLFCDGSLGSHTAALGADYRDAPGERGALRHETGALADHLVAATRAGLQAGFHVIGDAAVAQVLAAAERAAAEVGWSAFAAARHRLEHVEMCDADAVTRIAALGLVASIQPAFDAAWGGPDGMYERRLGTRAAGLNPIAGLAAAGVAVAFGSDAPVTPLDPWGAVRAATRMSNPAHAVSARAAFAAATRGGHRAARDDASGILVTGAPATLAIWDVAGELVVRVPDRRVADWSTDPRAGVAGLPDLDAPDPVCRATYVRGELVWEAP